jgi:2-isopropylmalate synthase
MSIEQKIKLGLELEALGVNVIETGFPAASENDFRTTAELASVIKGTKLCAFSRACHSDVETAFNAIRNAWKFQIEILTAVSDIHLRDKRRISRLEALEEAKHAVSFAVALGADDVSVAPEDATRADHDFLHRMIDTSIEAGAKTIALPDTVGCYLPAQFYELIKMVRSWVGDEIQIAAHAHNDLGLATANTLAAVEAGVDECQVTLCGIGERAGNAALEEVVAALVSRAERFARTITIDTTRIFNACSLLTNTLNLSLARAKPVIGANAFATAAGIHQSGILKNPGTYEFLDPQLFGRTREMAIERHSGRYALRARFEGMGVSLDEDDLKEVYELVVNSNQNSSFTDMELFQILEGVNAVCI